MRRLQVITEIGQTVVDPYARTLTHPPLRAAVLSWVSLAASAAAVVGCALPMLFVVLRIEAAAATSIFLAAIEHKNWIFGVSGLLLLLAGIAVWSVGCARTLDPEIARRCRRMRHLNRWTLRTSAGLWLAGILGAYIAMPVRMALGG